MEVICLGEGKKITITARGNYKEKCSCKKCKDKFIKSEDSA